MKSIAMIFVSSLFFTPHATVMVDKWVIEKNSNLCIEGRSNVSSFRCDVIEYLRQDTIQFRRDDARQQSLGVKGGLTINVDRFDCHQRYMTGDLRKTLKANECPLLKIDMLTIGNFMTAGKNVKGDVAITLAGVTRKMEIDYTAQADDDGTLHLYGRRQVLFSDFGLTPPRKLAGLITVEQQLNVRFLLVLRPLQSNPIGKINL